MKCGVQSIVDFTKSSTKSKTPITQQLWEELQFVNLLKDSSFWVEELSADKKAKTGESKVYWMNLLLLKE